MNKRGVVIFEIGLWMVRILLVIIIVAFTALHIRTAIDAKVDLGVAEPALLVHVIGNSPAFFYQDVTGTQQRVIDVMRFKTTQLDDAVSYKERHAAAKLMLFEADGKEIATIYLNQPYYRELGAQSGALQGKTVVKDERRWQVTLIEQGARRPGILNVEVVEPR
jgi:hypothetical protein